MRQALGRNSLRENARHPVSEIGVSRLRENGQRAYFERFCAQCEEECVTVMTLRRLDSDQFRGLFGRLYIIGHSYVSSKQKPNSFLSSSLVSSVHLTKRCYQRHNSSNNNSAPTPAATERQMYVLLKSRPSHHKPECIC
jgi:hypothetical protein